MSPVEIKIELMKAGVKQTDIARMCQVKAPHVYNVIHNTTVSARVRNVIAEILGKKAEQIWSE